MLEAWVRMMCRLCMVHARRDQRQLLHECGMDKVERKLPDYSEAQMGCAHLKCEVENNQWHRTVVCKTCRFRLGHRPHVVGDRGRS